MYSTDEIDNLSYLEKAKIFVYSKIAAELGDSLGELLLSICYDEGIGTWQSPQNSLFYLSKSVAHGNSEAISILGKIRQSIDQGSYSAQLEQSIQSLNTTLSEKDNEIEQLKSLDEEKTRQIIQLECEKDKLEKQLFESNRLAHQLDVESDERDDFEKLLSNLLGIFSWVEDDIVHQTATQENFSNIIKQTAILNKHLDFRLFYYLPGESIPEGDLAYVQIGGYDKTSEPSLDKKVSRCKEIGFVMDKYGLMHTGRVILYRYDSSLSSENDVHIKKENDNTGEVSE